MVEPPAGGRPASAARPAAGVHHPAPRRRHHPDPRPRRRAGRDRRRRPHRRAPPGRGGQPRGIRRAAGHEQTLLPACYRRWHGQLPGRPVHGEGRAGRREPARVGRTASRRTCRAARTSTSTANWLAIAACVQDVLAAAGASGDSVRAVAATSMREGIVLYDGAGQEIWACPNVDSRAGQEAVELIREGAADRIYALGGDWVAITSPARLRWLARHRPDILARTSGLGMLSDWIATRLSGVLATEPSCGSSSGMFSLADRAWSDEIAALSGLPASVLPPVHDPGTVIGAVTAAAAEQTGLRPGTPVVAGGADTQLGLLGAGARPGEYTVVAGTFWQNTILLDRPLIDPQIRLRTLCHVLPGQWMLEGIGFYCGMSMRWFRDAFCARRGRGGPPPGRGPLRGHGGSGGAGASRGGAGHLVQRHERAALGPRQPVVPAAGPRRPAAGLGPGGLRAGHRGGGRLRRPRAPGHHHRADRHRLRRARRSPAARPRARCGRRSSPTSSACRCTSRR